MSVACDVEPGVAACGEACGFAKRLPDARRNTTSRGGLSAAMATERATRPSTPASRLLENCLAYIERDWDRMITHEEEVARGK